MDNNVFNLLLKERNKTVNDLNQKIHIYENDLNNLRSENADLHKQIYVLEHQVSSFKNQIYQKNNIIKSLKNQYNILAQEKNIIVSDLSQGLNSNNQAINNFKNLILIKDQKIQELKSKVQLLKNQLNNYKVNTNSEQEIKQLKKDLQKKEEETKKDFKDISTTFTATFEEDLKVRFISSDNRLDTTISCFSWDKFSNLEEKLYQKFPEFRNENNFFISNGNVIQKDQTVSFNQINPGSPVMLII